jgi:hypothetical protein
LPTADLTQTESFALTAIAYQEAVIWGDFEAGGTGVQQFSRDVPVMIEPGDGLR